MAKTKGMVQPDLTVRNNRPVTLLRKDWTMLSTVRLNFRLSLGTRYMVRWIKYSSPSFLLLDASCITSSMLLRPAIYSLIITATMLNPPPVNREPPLALPQRFHCRVPGAHDRLPEKVKAVLHVFWRMRMIGVHGRVLFSSLRLGSVYGVIADPQLVLRKPF